MTILQWISAVVIAGLFVYLMVQSIRAHTTGHGSAVSRLITLGQMMFLFGVSWPQYDPYGAFLVGGFLLSSVAMVVQFRRQQRRKERA